MAASITSQARPRIVGGVMPEFIILSILFPDGSRELAVCKRNEIAPRSFSVVRYVGSQADGEAHIARMLAAREAIR